VSRDDEYQRGRDRTLQRIASENSQRPLGGVHRDDRGRPIGRPGQALSGREMELVAASVTRKNDRRAQVDKPQAPAPRQKVIRPANVERLADENPGRDRMMLNPEFIREGILSGEAAEFEAQVRREQVDTRELDERDANAAQTAKAHEGRNVR
jgi:hypothetical protein